MARDVGCVFTLLALAGLALGREFPLRETAGCSDGKIRGVNLGGWLVMEPWITPKIFEAVSVGEFLDKIKDEWTYAEYLDPEVYQTNMIHHWANYVSRQDFEILQSVGISHVRVPIAYWYWDVIDGEPFPAPNMDDTDENSPLFYLKRALTWMDELGLKASIDLHTGPGSQNGYDNSGRAGEIHWVDDTYPENRYNIDRTIDIHDQIYQTMRQWIEAGVFREETVYGIGILNEPHICGGWHDDGKYWPACRDDFYPLAYAKAREYFGTDVTVVLDQAGRGLEEFAGFFDSPETEVINIDAHFYQCFGGYWNAIAQSPNGWPVHLEEACNAKDYLSNAPYPTFVGEFSLSLTECTKYLNGFMTPYVPPDSTPDVCSYYNNDWSTYADDYKAFLAEFFLAQVDAYEGGAGWFMWTMKTEDNAAPEWDFLFLVQEGIVPADLCSKPAYC